MQAPQSSAEKATTPVQECCLKLWSHDCNHLGFEQAEGVQADCQQAAVPLGIGGLGHLRYTSIAWEMQF